MTYENPYYGKFYYEGLELIPGNRYVFITKQRTKFITSEKQLEGTFIGAEIDWKNTDEELPLLNPATCYKFKTEDGNIHIVSSKDITWMVPSPTSELFIPPYTEIPERPAQSIEITYIPFNNAIWEAICTEEDINNQGEIVYEP